MNDRIRVPRVRVVGADGQQVGILETKEALEMAQEQDLDLVEIAPQADPPVCKIMDYGKFKYEQDIRQREARKKQSNVVVKEMKMRPKIDTHDYETKKGHVVRFLRQGAKVKVTIMFRGRETARSELGRRLLDQLAEDVSEIARIETPAKLDGRNMTMVLNPLKEAIIEKPRPEPRHRPERRPAPVVEEAVEEISEEDDDDDDDDDKPSRPPIKITRAEGG